MQNLNVLVVEDDEDDFFLLQHYIQYSELWNIEFTLASNFKDGVELFKHSSFDLCFLDHYLGAQTGIDFLTEIKSFPKQIPIILLTGMDNKVIDNKAIEKGAADYIPKSSMSQEILERSIRHALERHKQNQLLKKEKEKYLHLFTGSMDAVFLTDADFHITEANHSFYELMKAEIGTELSLKQFFKKKGDFERLIRVSEGERHNTLNRVKCTDTEGNGLITNVSISKIDLPGENVSTAYQGVIQDVTELEEAQLRSIAEQKFNLTGRMARIIGHEVRNPLTNIILASNELEEDCEFSEDDMGLFDMIKRSAKRIESLTDELLNSTKMLELTVEHVPVEPVLQNAIKECEDRMQLKKVVLTTPDLTKETLLYLDQNKFQIALTNIIINATEAMSDTPEPHLQIEIKEEPKAVKIRITDNGKGMSKETIEKIYDPFFSDRHGGLGLGMTNVKNVVIQHNALLSVESEPGKGTTFTIKVPKKLKKTNERS